MNPLKKGPDLKMPDLKDLKMPPVLVDLFYDLRDRRLLPLVALVVVAIVAAPFLLGGESTKPATLPAGVAVLNRPRRQLRLDPADRIQAQPGLRDYRKRLAA